MEQQVRDAIPHLKVGATYLFEHRRSGPFVGQYQGSQPTDEGDAEDTLFLEIDIYTEDGSGQERLANAFIRDERGRKMRPPISKKFIRPSLLRSISSPSTTAQAQMLQQFTQIRQKAEESAKQTGGEPAIPVLSLPTGQTMQRLREPEQKLGRGPSWWDRLFGR